MKYIFYLLILMLAGGACSSDEPVKEDSEISLENRYQNLVQAEAPEDVETVPSKVYVDLVEVIDYKSEKALLISGNFASSCTSLKKVSHSTANDTLSITLTSHQPADKLCATVLTPFSYLFNELSSIPVTQISVVEVNEEAFKLDDI